MAKEFAIRLDGLKPLLKRLDRQFGPQPVRNALLGELVEEAEDLIGEAKLEVPVDLGPLRDSGIVLPPNARGEVECGFGGPSEPYALVQHENLSFSHTVGKAKYLEDPFNRMLRGFDKRVAAGLKRRLGI